MDKCHILRQVVYLGVVGFYPAFMGNQILAGFGYIVKSIASKSNFGVLLLIADSSLMDK
jgi:hypothetical protein